MAGPGSSRHLLAETLVGRNVTIELRRFASWLQTLPHENFEIVAPGITRCIAEGKKEAITPLIQELGFQDEPSALQNYSILRISQKSHIDPGSGSYLIPVRISTDVVPTIYNPPPAESPSKTQTKLTVGERVYFDQPVLVGGGVDCVIVG